MGDHDLWVFSENWRYTALGAALKAQVTKEQAYVESIRPAKRDKVGGLGGKAQAPAGEELYETLKRSYMRADPEMTEARAEQLARIASGQGV